jgi:hypothetical protein
MPSRRGHFLLLAQKKVTKEKGRGALIRCTPRPRIRSNRLRSRIKSPKRLRDSIEPLRSIGRLLGLWRLYRWGRREREIFSWRASAEGAACCGRRPKSPFSPHHFRWFLQRPTMSGAAWRQWGGLRLGRNPAEAESSTADNCFASRPVHTASCRGRPITGLIKASFAYFWTPWPKSKSRRQERNPLAIVPPKAASTASSLKREPVEKLRFSSFHALPAGLLSFAGPK